MQPSCSAADWPSTVDTETEVEKIENTPESLSGESAFLTYLTDYPRSAKTNF